MAKFAQALNNIHPLSENSKIELSKIFRIKTYPANYILVEKNKKSNFVFFLLEGVARSFSISPKGKEVNNIIYSDNSFLGCLPSLILDKKVVTPIQTLTECKLIQGNYKDYINLTNTHIDINTFHRKNLESFVIRLYHQDIGLANLNASQRYLNLIHQYPKIETKISQKNIALHLGITSVQLSRLKRDLRS